jgi:hypothetical protein
MKSEYETLAANLARQHFSTPDDAPLAIEKQQDHGHAVARGARVLAVCDSAIDALHAAGMLCATRTDARAQMFQPIADTLYGNQSVDIPNFREWNGRMK